MKVVIALDSFKGSLTAMRACSIVAETIESVLTETEAVLKPMADGGEGTAAALMAARQGQWIEQKVTGPAPSMQVDAGFVWLPAERTAVVEMASASGLELLGEQQRNPLYTTTYGTGQLIDAAIRHGAGRILLGVGGSATVDGGVGAALALGWRFLDEQGRDIPLGGAGLNRIGEIAPPSEPLEVFVDVLCDVDSPLCGPHGAARIYGPQKGATPEMVETLDAGLAHLATQVREQLGTEIAKIPGAGAAGGLAAGAVAFLDARLVSGVEVAMDEIRLREAVADADWVVTGEGCFDQQSLRGKVVSGVVRVAREGGARVAVLAGRVLVSPPVLETLGIDIALACMNDSMSLRHALTHSEELLGAAASRLARDHLAP